MNRRADELRPPTREAAASDHVQRDPHGDAVAVFRALGHGAPLRRICGVLARGLEARPARVREERVLEAERAIGREIHADVVVARYARAVGFGGFDESSALRYLESDVERRRILRDRHARRLVGRAPIGEIAIERYAGRACPRCIDRTVEGRRRSDDRDGDCGDPGRRGHGFACEHGAERERRCERTGDEILEIHRFLRDGGERGLRLYGEQRRFVPAGLRIIPA